MTPTPLIALAGNPNAGKSALFNALTGARQKVGNYPGVTVERKSGRMALDDGRPLELLDLPGTYSLTPSSPDEAVTHDVLLGKQAGERLPSALLVVVDATNLDNHLRFALQLIDLGLPTVIALNMVDMAERDGLRIDSDRLSAELGVPVIPTVAVRRKGIDELKVALGNLAATQATRPVSEPSTDHDALITLQRRARAIAAAATTEENFRLRWTHRADAVALHPVIGPILLATILFVMFQAVFAWSAAPADAIDGAFVALQGVVTDRMPDGFVRSLITEGLIAGVGAVIVFLPQILILFLFILLLEASGYMVRAAFIMDQLMARVGLSGRAFIPLLSSFACAIPGIMATRTIDDPKDRLTTILIAPLMTCSARLPVYALLIGAFVPEHAVAGILSFRGLVLFGLYLAGIVAGLLVSLVITLTRKDKAEHPLMMELPSYRLPNARNLAIGLMERAKIFMRRITGTILAANTILWVLTTFPSPPKGATGPAIDYSLAGLVGHALHPVFAPIGFNWQICVALIPGLTAREVAVSALGTVYSVSAGNEDAASAQLGHLISGQWTLATALSLLAWYVFAPQCMSTLAVIRRETNSWKMVAVTAGYLFALAYIASFVTYQIVSRL